MYGRVPSCPFFIALSLKEAGNEGIISFDFMDLEGRFVMKTTAMNKRKKRWIIPVVIISVAAAVFFIYFAVYYHAGDTAVNALENSENVKVSVSDDTYFFDGPSDENAFIFYPGAKVEAAAYAPLMRDIAENDADVFLVNMPLNFPFFGSGRAEDIINSNDYESWFIGGHSLGGVAAAGYASSHADMIEGVVLCASYPSDDISSLKVLSLYGTNDSVLNREKYEESRKYLPEDMTEVVLEGGNHAQFGDYGEQDGDTPADMTAGEQQAAAAEAIGEFISR